MKRLSWLLGFLISIIIGCFGGADMVKKEDPTVKKSEVHGIVETDDGERQPGLKVAMMHQGNPVGETVLTDGDGEFLLRDVPRGIFEIEISGNASFEPVKQTVRHDFVAIPILNMAPIILESRRTSFTGRVIYKDAQDAEVPIAGAVVALIGTEDQTRTDREGKFNLSSGSLIEGVPYMIKVFAGSDFEPEIVPLPNLKLQSEHVIGAVPLKPLSGVTDPKTRIPASYRPPDTGGTIIQGR